MGNANCGAKARKRAQAQAAAAAYANRRMGQAAGGSANLESLAGIGGNQDMGGASSDTAGAYSSGVGGGYVYAMQCPEGIDQDIALLATAAALAVGIYVVYRHET